MKMFFVEKRAVITFFVLLAVVISLAVYSKTSTNTASVKSNIPIYCVQTDKKQVAITFDSAWDDSDLDDILKTLKDYDCKATFFVVGDFIDKYPDRIKQMYENGNEIANHSNTHPHTNSLSRDEMIKEMDDCDAKIKGITGQSDVLFRAPYGEYNDLLVKTCTDTGRFCIQWDCEAKATPSNAQKGGYNFCCNRFCTTSF